VSAGRLERIWVKRAKLGPMDPRPTVRLVAGRGLEGSSDQGGKRQVTVIAVEAWADALAELAGLDGAGPDGAVPDLDPSARRANLLVSGILLAGSRGRVLAIGGCRLLIRGETRPCERMERARPGLKAALGPDWRGGVYAEVIAGGEIAAGDAVALEPATPETGVSPTPAAEADRAAAGGSVPPSRAALDGSATARG
jgi:MOSC domain-containing protein YiiM